MWGWSAASHIACKSHFGYYSALHLHLEVIWQAAIPSCPACTNPFSHHLYGSTDEWAQSTPSASQPCRSLAMLFIWCAVMLILHRRYAQLVVAGSAWSSWKRLWEKSKQKGRRKWKFLLLSHSNTLGWGKSIHWTSMAFSILLPEQQKDEQP